RVQRAGDEARRRKRQRGFAAQRQQLLRHVHGRGVGIASGWFRELVPRVDPCIERLAHLPGAERGILVALAPLDTDLFGADRRRGPLRQRLEGRAAGDVWIGVRVDLTVDPGLVEPGDAGDGADLGIYLRSRLRLGRVRGGGRL